MVTKSGKCQALLCINLDLYYQYSWIGIQPRKMRILNLSLDRTLYKVSAFLIQTPEPTKVTSCLYIMCVLEGGGVSEVQLLFVTQPSKHVVKHMEVPLLGVLEDHTRLLQEVLIYLGTRNCRSGEKIRTMCVLCMCMCW